MNSELRRIRDAEKRSHQRVYSANELFEQGSWLEKPVKTVMDLLPLFEDYQELRTLDLGSGVGRNSIPVAQRFRNIPCRVECVDILDFAIEKLHENAKKLGVAASIHGIVSPIEDYPIESHAYDLILAVSSLEHIDSERSFIRKLTEIRSGIRENGIACLVINTNVTERVIRTGERIWPQFEVNLPTEQVLEILDEIFGGWKWLKKTIVPQRYEIPRDIGMVALSTDVVTCVVRKNDRSQIL